MEIFANGGNFKLQIAKTYPGKSIMTYAGKTATMYLGKALISMSHYYPAEIEADARLVTSLSMHICV
jgi:hypothetical protein